MRHFCTYFDRNYLVRAMALYDSLERHAGPFTLWALCFDDFSFDALTRLGLPDFRPVAQADFERGDGALLAAKPARSRVEYFFTCSPSWPLYLLDRHPEVDVLTYLDADLYFFSSPAPVFDELGDGSVLIVGHRFAPSRRHLEVHGIYNVGLLAFRNDAAARECLHWWRGRCLEWCGLQPEEGKFADQKYLDDWPQRFPGTRVLQHKGAGLAPWNAANYDIRKTDGRVTVDGEPLVFYHYHGIKFFGPRFFGPRFLQARVYDPVLLGRGYGDMPRAALRLLYPSYVRALREAARRLQSVAPGTAIETTSVGDYGWRAFLGKLRRGRLMLDLTRLEGEVP